VSRLILAIASVLLVFAPAARADDVSVTLPVGVLTNAPTLTIGVSPAGTPMQCRLSGDAFARCTSPWTPALPAAAEDRAYTYDVLVGGFLFGGSFTLDRTAPQIEFTAGPADGAAQRERTATYAFTSTDAHPGQVECDWDGVATPCAGGVTVNGLADGDHALTVRATDALGNGAAATRHLTVVQPIAIVDPGPTPTATPTPQGGVLSASAAKPSAHLTSTRTRGWTRLRTLTLRDVAKGTAIKATCKSKGSGCPKRALRVTATKDGAVSLAGLTGRKLRPGAVITITLSRQGDPTQTIRIMIRSLRAPQIG
jgi:hypothetical protein